MASKKKANGKPQKPPTLPLEYLALEAEIVSAEKKAPVVKARITRGSEELAKMQKAAAGMEDGNPVTRALQRGAIDKVTQQIDMDQVELERLLATGRKRVQLDRWKQKQTLVEKALKMGPPVCRYCSSNKDVKLVEGIPVPNFTIPGGQAGWTMDLPWQKWRIEYTCMNKGDVRCPHRIHIYPGHPDGPAVDQ